MVNSAANKFLTSFISTQLIQARTSKLCLITTVTEGKKCQQWRGSITWDQALRITDEQVIKSEY